MTVEKNRRILVIDDNRAIHVDMRKIFVIPEPSGIEELEGVLFGDAPEGPEGYEIDSAYQGEEGLGMVERALRAGRPYAVVFVDMRMPPGWDGFQTIEHIWGVDPELQIVICTAYSDHSWDEIHARFGSADRLLILKKPFDVVEVRQLVGTLTEKWRLAQAAAQGLLKLNESLALAHAIQEAVVDGVLVTDRDRNVVRYNGRFAEMWRIPPEIMAGGDNEELLAFLLESVSDPDDLEARIRHLGAHPDEVSQGEVRLKRGGVLERWSGPVRSSDGVIQARLWCFRDVTAQRAQDAERIVLTERMTSLGRLAAGVGHEINNPLAYVTANVEHLARRLEELTGVGSGPADDLTEVLQDTRDGLERIRLVVRDLQALARPSDEIRANVDLEGVLEGAIRIASNELRHRARLVRRYDRVSPVSANEPRLGQVFVNLLLNAAQAIPEGRAAENEITVELTSGGEGWVRVAIHDTGAGIAEDDLERVFDPFLTTRGVGSGTGLGLSICKGIVEACEGRISAQRRPSGGTTFTVMLPMGTAAIAREERPSTLPAPGARVRILVIDDERSIARMIARALDPAHDVVTCTDPSEALLRLKGGEHFDVILCDLMMPDLTGMDVYAEVEKSRPALVDRMVFLTGGAFTPRADEFLSRVQNVRLDKPIDMRALRGVIASMVAPDADPVHRDVHVQDIPSAPGMPSEERPRTVMTGDGPRSGRSGNAKA